LFKKNKQIEDKIEIIASPSGENICQFIASVDFLEGQVTVGKSGDWFETPFVKAIFSAGEIEELVFNKNKLLIKKRSDTSWPEIGKKIGKTIRDYASAGDGNFFPKELLDSLTKTKEKENEKLPQSDQAALQSDLGKKVIAILEEKISPALAAHGGFVKLIDIKGPDIHLNFSGGCQGCAQVSTTVKGGVEQVLRDEIGPEINIVDVTDHSGGENPYYK